GLMLTEYAQRYDSETAPQYFLESFDKFESAARIAPDDYDISRYWLISLYLYYGYILSFQPNQELLEQALILKKAIDNEQELSIIYNELATMYDMGQKYSSNLKKYGIFLHTLADSLEVANGLDKSGS
ncbi:MAG: hypothetical protein ABIJ45_09835, partial [Candidatus Zixiibacteriota bacterium]